jgi:hypothetical protein
MSYDLQIRFQLDGNHDVHLKAQNGSYSIKGDQKGMDFVKDCLSKLPSDSLDNLSQAGKELKARLWQVGAKEISLSSVNDTHKIGLPILIDEAIDVRKTIEDICSSLEEHYIFPDVASKSVSFFASAM